MKFWFQKMTDSRYAITMLCGCAQRVLVCSYNNYVLHALNKNEIWQHRASQPHPRTFWAPFRISIRACTLLNGHHPVGRPLALDPPVNILATPKHRITSPLPCRDRAALRRQNNANDWMPQSRSCRENERSLTLVYSNSQSAKET